MTVEKLIGADIPKRVQYMRVIVMELARIADHLICNGILGVDTGAFTGFLYIYQERENIYEIYEEVCGSSPHGPTIPLSSRFLLAPAMLLSAVRFCYRSARFTPKFNPSRGDAGQHCARRLGNMMGIERILSVTTPRNERAPRGLFCSARTSEFRQVARNVAVVCVLAPSRPVVLNRPGKVSAWALAIRAVNR